MQQQGVYLRPQRPRGVRVSCWFFFCNFPSQILYEKGDPINIIVDIIDSQILYEKGYPINIIVNIIVNMFL